MQKIGTKRLGRASRSVAALAVAGLLLAACGGGDDPAPGGGGTGNGGGAQEPGDDNGAAEGLPEGVVSDDWDEIVAAAEDEGTLVIAVHRGPGYEQWCVEVTRWMSEEHGITVDCSAHSPSDFIGRVVAEQQAGEYLWDIIVAATGNIQASLNPIGGTQVLDPWFDILPDDVTSDDNWIGGFDVYSDENNQTHLHEYLLSGGTYVNTDLLDLTDPAQLLDEEWRGRLIARDPTGVNGGSMSLGYFLADDAFGEDGLRSLIHDQEMVFVDSPDVMLQWVADGRAVAGFGANLDELIALQDVGLGLNVEQLELAQYVIAMGTAVLASNPHPNATAVFLRWHLSQEGQTTWVQTTRVNSSSRRVDVDAPSPELSPDYNDMDRYPPVIGTAEGTLIVEEVTEIALDG